MNVQTSIFEFGSFCFDTSQQELRQRGRRVRLSLSLIKLLTRQVVNSALLRRL
jgi:hypothetical protein